MKHERDDLERQSGIPPHPERAASAVAVLVGAILGVGVGIFSFSGTLFVLVAAVVGAIAGFVVAQLSQRRYRRNSLTDARLDW